MFLRPDRDEQSGEQAKLLEHSPSGGQCPCPSMPIRYEIAILASIGFLLSFGLRCNLGASVVDMTHNQTSTLPNGSVQLIKVTRIFFVSDAEYSRDVSIARSVQLVAGVDWRH